MSREEGDARLHSCIKKYEEIVKQVLLLDELTDAMDPRSRLISKKKTVIEREVYRSLQNPRSGNRCNGNNSGSALDRESFDQVIVQTITKFLHDLNTSAIDPNPSTSNH